MGHTHTKNKGNETMKKDFTYESYSHKSIVNSNGKITTYCTLDEKATQSIDEIKNLRNKHKYNLFMAYAEYNLKQNLATYI